MNATMSAIRANVHTLVYTHVAQPSMHSEDIPLVEIKIYKQKNHLNSKLSTFAGTVEDPVLKTTTSAC